MKKTGVDRFATSGFVRFCVVVGWFTITTMAFFSRYEKMSAGLATAMGALIVLISTLGLSWAATPASSGKSVDARHEALRGAPPWTRPGTQQQAQPWAQPKIQPWTQP